MLAAKTNNRQSRIETMDHVLALDQGTTSSRAILFDRGWSHRRFGAEGIPAALSTTGLGGARSRGNLGDAAHLCADGAAQRGDRTGRVAAVGITNQRETTLLWDRTTGVPIAPRSSGRTAALPANAQRCVSRGTKHGSARRPAWFSIPTSPATKIAWLLDHVPGARARADRGELAFGTVDSWLIWNLTGGTVHVTDVSNASRTLLFDLATLQWDDELLALFRVPRKVLPRITSSSEVVGQSRSELFGASMAIAGIAGDQQAATFGQACFAPGMAKNTYGTGCFMLMNIGARPALGTTTCSPPWLAPGRRRTDYMLEGSVFVAGAVVQWLRDGLGIIESSDHVEALARQAADNGGVYLVPAFVGLGAPHWDPDARGTIIGLTRGSTRAHIARAALEVDRVPIDRRDAGDALDAGTGRSANCAWMAARRATIC